MKRFALLAILALAFAASCAAQTQTWQIDPAHSTSQFSVSHLAIATVRGVFEKTTGTVVFDPANPSKTQIDATIDASMVDTRVQMRDNDLRSPHFFDVEKYPTITFKSKRTEVDGPGKLKVTGDLTMHGTTKEVVLEVEGPTAPINTPMGDIRMGASATTKISRHDFGVDGGAGVAGDEIQITLDVELKRPK
jgi:polyisoprenoid-binding protein YceI